MVRHSGWTFNSFKCCYTSSSKWPTIRVRQQTSGVRQEHATIWGLREYIIIHTKLPLSSVMWIELVSKPKWLSLNGGRAHYIIESKVQWKPFDLPPSSTHSMTGSVAISRILWRMRTGAILENCYVMHTAPLNRQPLYLTRQKWCWGSQGLIRKIYRALPCDPTNLATWSAKLTNINCRRSTTWCTNRTTHKSRDDTKWNKGGQSSQSTPTFLKKTIPSSNLWPAVNHSHSSAEAKTFSNKEFNAITGSCVSNRTQLPWLCTPVFATRSQTLLNTYTNFDRQTTKKITLTCHMTAIIQQVDQTPTSTTPTTFTYTVLQSCFSLTTHRQIDSPVRVMEVAF